MFLEFSMLCLRDIPFEFFCEAESRGADDAVAGYAGKHSRANPSASAPAPVPAKRNTLGARNF